MSHTGIRVFTVSALHADGYAVSSAVSSGGKRGGNSCDLGTEQATSGQGSPMAKSRSRPPTPGLYGGLQRRRRLRHRRNARHFSCKRHFALSKQYYCLFVHMADDPARISITFQTTSAIGLTWRNEGCGVHLFLSLTHICIHSACGVRLSGDKKLPVVARSDGAP